MTAHYPAPIQEDVRDLLIDLLGRGVAVDKTSKLELEDDACAIVGVYATDDGELAALTILDGALGARAGAALSMVPQAVADEAIKKNELTETLIENIREVINIFARFLNSAKTPHVRLINSVVLPSELDPKVHALRAAPEFRRDFVVQIEGYGSGRFSILVA
jgi:hypothetical protein